MIIDCISDLHGSYPILEGGDLLIIAGDLTAVDSLKQYEDFAIWLKKQEYKRIIVVAGNHDKLLGKTQEAFTFLKDDKVHYLFNDGIEFEGLNIWGSPHTKWFAGVNPHCNAFMLQTDTQMKEIWDIIPYNTDILITHGPPRDILDKTTRYDRVGCIELEKAVKRVKPRLHVFGHIHEGYGTDIKEFQEEQSTFVNCAHMNVDYDPVNKPIRIIL
jgi:Icc-related predicted phosphoesterase